MKVRKKSPEVVFSYLLRYVSGEWLFRGDLNRGRLRKEREQDVADGYPCTPIVEYKARS